MAEETLWPFCYKDLSKRPETRPIEFLLAWEDHTWTTEVFQVPGDLDTLDQLTEWATEFIVESRHDLNSSSLVAVAVYHIGENEEKTDEIVW